LVPHREFLFHRLIRSGASHASAATLYGLLSAIGGLLGLFMIAPGVPPVAKACVPAMIAVLAGLLTYIIERQCRQAGLPSAATRYSSALQ
jgi:uncharacterized membrane protein (UPF0136 family)